MNITDKFPASIDSLGGEKSVLHTVLSIIMGSAIILNVTGMIFLFKDKDNRKHTQCTVFTTISTNEIFIDLLYIFLVLWRGDIGYICLVANLLFSVGRHNLFTHLIYVCVERFCALKLSRKKIFSRMTKLKCRMIFLGCSIILSLILFMPPYVLYGKGKTKACGLEAIFYHNTRFVVSYLRTIYCIEILVMSVIYLCIAKEIRTLINTVQNSSSQQQQVTTICVQPLPDSSHSTQTTTAVQGALNNVVDFEGEFQAGPSSQIVSPTTARKKLPMMKKERVKITRNETRDNAGSKWKLRAFKMVRYSLLSTIIPNIPMIVTQIVGYIRPELLNDTVDIVISLCNLVHAILFPLMFIVTVKAKPQS